MDTDVVMSTSSCSEFSEMSQDGEESMRRAQIKAYVDWVNAQLKKRPGHRLVEDLKTDMQDGVALLNLVSIIAGLDLGGHTSPSNYTEKVDNITRVINFMTERRIKMHYTTAKDIVDGNVKAIMRLILALAAHYKPNSVKHSSRSGSRATTPLAGIAQSAAVALADARRDAAMTVHRPQRPPHLGHIERPETMGYITDHRHFSHSLDGASSCGSPSTVSGLMSPPQRGAASTNHRPGSSPGGAVGRRRLEFGNGAKSRSQDVPAGAECYSAHDDSHTSEADTSAVLSLLEEEHGKLGSDVTEAKRTLLALQSLLLSGGLSEGEDSAPDCAPVVPSTNGEEVIVLRSKLTQAEEMCNDLRDELSKTRAECRQLVGVKSGLEQRLTEQENSFLVLKAELLRAGFCKQSLENTKNELEQKLSDKEKLLASLKRDLSRASHQNDELQVDHQLHLQERRGDTHHLRSQILNLHDKIKKASDAELSLGSRMSAQDRRLGKIENRIIQSGGHTDNNTKGLSDSEDFQLVRESLQSLRNRFPGDDPQHQTIDALEQSISVLMDRLNVTEEQRWSDASSLRRLDDSSSDRSRSYRHPSGHQNSSHSAATKVLYFTDQTVTPFMCTVNKRLGEITLRDIKSLVDHPGNYRYHFKAMDPEFGTVKEEITSDEDVIPGWEGKIVAWIEEDHG